MEKKQWQTPQLISLVRRDPQEAVLVVCKTWTDAAGSVPSTGFAGCNEPWPGVPDGCQACSTWNDS
jgi:hypothetical protein